MTKHEFLHSTPRDIQIFLDSARKDDELRAKREDYIAWQTGAYIRFAVASVLNGKKNKYPKRPFSEQNKEHSESIVATEEMSEEEKERTRQLFLGNLKEMQRSFEGGA